MHRICVRRAWLAIAAGMLGVVSCGGPPTEAADGGVIGVAGGGAPDAGPSVDAGVRGAVGSPCATAQDCGSGFCADGVCCTTACVGTCEACVAAKTSAAEGTCAPVTVNTDPDDECTAAAGTCDTGLCSGAAACGRAQNGEVCRPAAGPCDAAETCTNNTCPADVLAPATTVCRPSGGPCDLPEACSAGTAACPADAFATSTSVCRASAGDCDVEERCSGTAATCPPDTFAATQTTCRAARGPCDVDEHCSGASASCPADARAPSTEVCRPEAGPCDVAERCTGTTDTCPADALAPSTLVCRAAAGVCDREERCSGTPACPTDTKLTTVCRAAVGVCDLTETCDGMANDCPANTGQPATTEVCAPYRCSAATFMCTSGTCNSDSQCAPGSFCRGSACVRGKRIFVTSTTTSGGFGGLIAGDSLCQGRAQAAGLAGTYKAWLSASTANARDRITQSTAPYFKRLGQVNTVIANNFTELTSNGTIRNINANETGAMQGGFVWTGTNNSGGSSAPNCSDWTASSSVSGRFGTIGANTIPSWTDDGSGPCSFPRALYCIEQ